jgi:hypothetical protein
MIDQILALSWWTLFWFFFKAITAWFGALLLLCTPLAIFKWWAES